MSAPALTVPARPARAALPGDLVTVFVLAALPMLAALALPWVLLRPNRIAPGEALHLPLPDLIVGAVLALALPVTARLAPRALWLVSALALSAGFWWLGTRTTAALADQLPFARASASSGVWLWLLGSAVAAYGARLAARTRTERALGLLWLLPLAFWAFTGFFTHWSVVVEGTAERDRLLQEFVQHLTLVGSALAIALLLGGPLAVLASRRPRVAGAVLSVANAVQTIPSLALLGLLIAPFSALGTAFPALRDLGIRGIGVAPALTAMTLYALLPVLRNGVVALTGVPEGVLDAARGMGMTDAQRFWRVQLPLALPVWLTGVRQAAVLLMGVAAIASQIGAGGLGVYIFKGLQSSAADLILLGAIPAVLLAVLINALLHGLEALLARRLGRA
ncbi:ABC transporter permease [Deinococcus aquiradiocola]|uniref:Osmoprotectant uptake system permease n=1 Tax=Deinococcus aquiradiocola TaxID=393059 RepID=A0A917PFF5_9DEIO|nr:ABC transporter permease [Deinococcus aquiradiocola]GGJ74563.1 osmoprotectant uptake system permease [Deinococcus aquiradiocola]